jgi:hypothetical protein
MKLVASLSLCVASAALCLPARAQEAEEHRRFPPSSVRTKVIAGGLLVTGAGYGAALGTAYGWADAPGADELKIPIVGPWVALAKAGCPASDPECGFSLYLRGFLTALEGLIQIGGVGLVAQGVFMTTEAAPPSQPVRRSESAWTIRPMPLVTPTFTGAVVVGSF